MVTSIKTTLRAPLLNSSFQVHAAVTISYFEHFGLHGLKCDLLSQKPISCRVSPDIQYPVKGISFRVLAH